MNRYEKLISQHHPLTVDKVIEVSARLLPQNMRHAPWKYVNHGITVAQNEEWLLAYMTAYGEMHEIKCRAAMQNIQYDDLMLNMEIVDWGCGQGIATLTMLDTLAEHGKIDLVKKITLIEPSAVAISRAFVNIKYSFGAKAEVETITKYLPSDTPNAEREIVEYKASQPCVIHLFSNILDIPNINLVRLSEIVSGVGRYNIVICAGPCGPNSFRIPLFAGYFHERNEFSNICASEYARTSDTGHLFGCRTNSFTFENTNVAWDGKNDTDTYENQEITWDYVDDYSPVSSIFAGKFPMSLLRTYEAIENYCKPTDRLYLRPDINGDAPDIIIYSPAAGIAVVQVMDMKDYEQTESLSEKILQVNSYAERLINLHIDKLKEYVERDSYYIRLIKKCIVISDRSQEEVDKLNVKAKDIYIVSYDSIGWEFMLRLGMVNSDGRFTEDIRKAFLSLVNSPWHSYREGKRFKLTRKQEGLIVSRPGKQKVKGCAGSGKTQVLAWRAVNANKRTGKPVLILTFNLTLRNYMKYRLSEIPADFSWNSFLILNYHEFFNSQALNCGEKVKNLDAYADIDYFEDKKVKKYSAIFIDEVQDYERPWLEILMKYFLEPGGEMVVFGDKDQNVYQRDLDNGEIAIPQMPGQWNKMDAIPLRFRNPKLASLVQRFSESFLGGEMETAPELSLDDESVIKYCDITKEQAELNACRWALMTMEKYHLKPAETVILSSTSDLLRRIEVMYNNQTHLQAKTTFLPEDLYQMAKKKGAMRFVLTEKNIQRTKRLHFTTDTPLLKLSTIHSFKGWEIDNVILFIQSEEKNRLQKPLMLDDGEPTRTAMHEKSMAEAPAFCLLPEVIFTAITRARKRLFIFNISNSRYQDFFKNNIQ